MTSMQRTRLALTLIVALGLLSAACGSNATFRPVGAASPSCSGNEEGGDAVAPAAGVKGGTRWLFRCDRPKVAFQQASIKLADLVGSIHGLGTAGLKSTGDAAAVMLVEDDPAVPWGTHLHDAEQTLFRTFAGDKRLGDWLILVTDVVVHAAKDPIPPTAYRWTRAEVAAYVSCGMPPAVSDPCHETFWTSADQVVLAPAGGQPHGR
jgi:hypothetical protein